MYLDSSRQVGIWEIRTLTDRTELGNETRQQPVWRRQHHDPAPPLCWALGTKAVAVAGAVRTLREPR